MERKFYRNKVEIMCIPPNPYFDGIVSARPSEHLTAGMERSIGSFLDSEQCLFFEID